MQYRRENNSQSHLYHHTWCQKVANLSRISVVVHRSVHTSSGLTSHYPAYMIASDSCVRRSGNDFSMTQRQRLAVVNYFIETKGSFYLFWRNDLLQGCNCGAMVVTDYLGVICTIRSPLWCDGLIWRWRLRYVLMVSTFMPGYVLPDAFLCNNWTTLSEGYALDVTIVVIPLGYVLQVVYNGNCWW